jgi:hypothetical protein
VMTVEHHLEPAVGDAEVGVPGISTSLVPAICASTRRRGAGPPRSMTSSWPSRRNTKRPSGVGV